MTESENPTPEVGSVEDACSLLGIGRNTGYRLARAGTLPGILKLGPRCYRVSLPALRKALESGSLDLTDSAA